jgi:hypothetical protein
MERIYMAIAREGWGTGPTGDEALRVCARHIPEEVLPIGGTCRLQLLTVPPGSEMDLHCTRIEWPEGHDPDRAGTQVVGFVDVTLEEDARGWLQHTFGELEPPCEP